jgi:sugar phosphate isomerase/epimerase
VDTLAEPPRPPGVSYEDAWRRTVDTFGYYAEYAQRHGIVAAWEFEPGFMFNKPSEILGLVKAVDHPNLTVMFDFCHAHMCAGVGARQRPPQETLPGGAVELAQRLQGHIGFVHLIDSDNTLHAGITSTHAPLGRGVLDIAQLVQTVLEAGYQNPTSSRIMCLSVKCSLAVGQKCSLQYDWSVFYPLDLKESTHAKCSRDQAKAPESHGYPALG